MSAILQSAPYCLGLTCGTWDQSAICVGRNFHRRRRIFCRSNTKNCRKSLTFFEKQKNNSPAVVSAESQAKDGNGGSASSETKERIHLIWINSRLLMTLNWVKLEIADNLVDRCTGHSFSGRTPISSRQCQNWRTSRWKEHVRWCVAVFRAMQIHHPPGRGTRAAKRRPSIGTTRSTDNSRQSISQVSDGAG